MVFIAGDIIHLLAPTTGYKKYHICLEQNEYSVTLCLFLNSEGGFAGNLEFDCAKFPMLPKSNSGKTVVSLSMLPRYNEKQLELYKAEKLGVVPLEIAKAIIEAVSSGLKTLTKSDREFVASSLTEFVKKNG